MWESIEDKAFVGRHIVDAGINLGQPGLGQRRQQFSYLLLYTFYGLSIDLLATARINRRAESMRSGFELGGPRTMRSTIVDMSIAEAKLEVNYKNKKSIKKITILGKCGALHSIL
jgi:hypothetical protein